MPKARLTLKERCIVKYERAINESIHIIDTNPRNVFWRQDVHEKLIFKNMRTPIRSIINNMSNISAIRGIDDSSTHDVLKVIVDRSEILDESFVQGMLALEI